MFLIIKNGDVISMTFEPHYIKKDGELRDGIKRFSSCNKSEAEGIAISGKVYNLIGKELLPGLDEVHVAEMDAGALIHESKKNQTETDSLVVEHEYKLILMEMEVSE